MVDMSAISSFMTSVDTLVKIASALQGIHNATNSDAKLFDLQRAAIDTQRAVLQVNEECAALIKRTGELENEIARLRNWEAEKQKYDLVHVSPNGPVAYVQKEAVPVGKSPVYVCATCFERGKKSPLQPEVRSPGNARVLVCNECGAEIYKSGIRQPEHRTGRPLRPR